MSTRGYARLPRAFTDFYNGFVGHEIPDTLEPLFNAFKAAIEANYSPRLKPVVTLNRCVGQALRRHPRSAQELLYWLTRRGTVSHAQTSGLYWAWSIWVNAAKHLRFLDVNAAQAFGADKPGPQRQMKFSQYEDAGILATHLIATGIDQVEAKKQAIAAINPNLDESLVHKKLSMVKALELSGQALADQAAAIKSKYT